MKPGRMPARRAPLVARKGLERKSRLRARSAKRSEPDRLEEEARVRAIVFARDGGCLLRRHQSQEEWGPCMGRLTFHHLRKGGQGGTYTADNGVCLCQVHNDAIEDHPDKAKRWGLVVNAAIDPAVAHARRARWAVTLRSATP